MDSILSAHQHLESKSNLSKALADVDNLIATLQFTRDAIASSPDLTPLHLTKLKQPLKQSFDKIEEDLKDVNKGLNQYQKALKDKFKNTSLPTAALGGEEDGRLERQSGLVNRAIAMHLLREGKFAVAMRFVGEVDAESRQRRRQRQAASNDEDGMDGVILESEEGEVAQDEDDDQQAWIQDFLPDPASYLNDGGGDGEDDIMSDYGHDIPQGQATSSFGKGQLQQKFSEMYHILNALRNHQNLQPAIDWAHEHSADLEARGSTLEFELARLKFVELYSGSSTTSSSESEEGSFDLTGPLAALEYARSTFPTFPARYHNQAATLLGSLAFSPSLETSPYSDIFSAKNSGTSEIDQTFTTNYLTHLNLPSSSPLGVAVTAGSIALPKLTKFQSIMSSTKGGQWTSVNELPVETPLPPGFIFHSIFVCPVSKEQATDTNWPVMLPCGHVIARESLEAHARGKSRVKCPYCPLECRVGEGKRVVI
jgi:E3 ubiquitin-protein transferase RMND5